jgi:hypothetical protein
MKAHMTIDDTPWLLNSDASSSAGSASTLAAAAWPMFFTESKELEQDVHHAQQYHQTPEEEWTDEPVFEFRLNDSVEVIRLDSTDLTDLPVPLEQTATSVEPTQPSRLRIRAPSQAPKFWVFTWLNQIYHNRVRLANQESLLIDIGAVGNLCGVNWANRMQTASTAHGQGASWKTLSTALNLEGVGENATRATREVTLPIAFENGRTGSFKSAVIETGGGIDLPALLGLETLTKYGALICCNTRRLIFPGKGGYKLNLSPGSDIHQLYAAPTGHLMLPCAEWEKQTILKKGAQEAPPTITL